MNKWRWPARALPGGIRARLFLLLTLVLLPMISLLIWSNYQRFSYLRQDELRTELEVAQGIATTFATYVNDVRQQLYIVGEGILILSPYTDAKATHLVTAAAISSPGIDSVSWVDPGGTIRVCSRPEMVGLRLDRHPVFQQIQAGAPWAISDLDRANADYLPVFAIATALRDDRGELLGLVVAGVGPEQVGKVILSQKRPAGGAFILFDRRGVVAYISREPSLTWEESLLWLESDPLLQQALATGRPQAGNMEPFGLEGRWLSARAPIAGLGWVAGAGRPAEIALAPVRQTMIGDGLFLLLITSIAFLLAYLLARTISGPLLQLEHEARKVGGGGSLAGDDPRAPAEVNSLRHTVTAMAASLVQAKVAAEEASRAKSEFLANMSHELRTPLTVILGSLELLQRSATDPETRQLTDSAHHSADRLLGIIDDLLDIARIEAGRLMIEEESFGLRDCVQRAVEMFVKACRDKGVDLRWSVAPSIPSPIRGDPDRLEQILINLIGNAVKFTRQGEISVTVSRTADDLVFTVDDTGIGIPAEHLGRLFNPFTQVDSSLARQYGGTGLGLAISRELVELMEGTIRAESEPGRGSRFIFTLPLRPAQPQEEPAPAPEREPCACARALRVLLVEDDPMVRELVRIMLDRRGISVTLAENGSEGVSRWQEGAFDLILMDLQMPGMDGIETTRLIRRVEAERETRTCIFALTAHARREDREKCLAAGMDGVLTKPLRMEELNLLLESCPCASARPPQR